MNTLPQDLSLASIMKRNLVIDPEQGGSWLDIVRTDDQAAAIELLLDLCGRAEADVNIRFAGGCKGFDAEMVEKLFKFLARGFVSLDGQRILKGAVGSGGTMDFDSDGAESVMITQVPYYLARLFPSVAWGSTPQTFRLRLDQDHGNVIVSKYGAMLDHRGHMNVLTQNDAVTVQEWNGDVRWYMGALAAFARRNYKVGVYMVNGGDITLDEGLLALSKGIPVIAIDGTGRAAEQFIEAYRGGAVAGLYEGGFQRDTLDVDEDEIPDDDEIERLVRVAQIDDPAALSRINDELGFLS